MTTMTLAIACGTPVDESAADPQTNDTSTSLPGLANPPQRVPESDPPLTGEAPSEILDLILANATERSGVSQDRLVVIRDEFVEWSDGSLGCPEPGMLYPQVITPGYWVVVDAGEQRLDYRATDQGHIRLCEAHRP